MQSLRYTAGESPRVEENEGVRAVVERSHVSRAQDRAQRRHEAQARARQIDLSDYSEEVTDKEYKTVLNLCKTGKISAVELKR